MKNETNVIARGYQFYHSKNTRNQVELLESRIRKKRTQSSNHEINEIIGQAIPDLGHSKGRDAKIDEIVDLY